MTVFYVSNGVLPNLPILPRRTQCVSQCFRCLTHGSNKSCMSSMALCLHKKQGMDIDSSNILPLMQGIYAFRRRLTGETITYSSCLLDDFTRILGKLMIEGAVVTPNCWQNQCLTKPSLPIKYWNGLGRKLANSLMRGSQVQLSKLNTKDKLLPQTQMQLHEIVLGFKKRVQIFTIIHSSFFAMFASDSLHITSPVYLFTKKNKNTYAKETINKQFHTNNELLYSF